ncbi:MAG TPA: hypothetical protein VGA95_07795 [Thermodesulfobacteriota bacterium]
MKQWLLSVSPALMLFVSTQAVSVLLPNGREFLDRRMIGGVS